MLQDAGKDMTEKEKEQWLKNPKRRKAHFVANAERFYPDLWKLAVAVHKIIEANKTDFPRLTINESNARHAIGLYIAKHRRFCARADINNINDIDFHIHANTMENKDRRNLYHLLQTDLLRTLHNMWGHSVGEIMKKITVDDKVRLFGIIFNNPDVREYIPDLTMKSKSEGNRRGLDGNNPRRAAAIKLILANFIDPEVEVQLPPKWLEDTTREAIDNQKGAGTFEAYGKFNPNDSSRMKLPWTEQHIKTIFSTVMTEYNAAMVEYTKGTGGGPGDDANYVCWQERDPTRVAGYSDQPSRIYLTVIHIWDKQYSYPCVVSKDPMPNDCQREDDEMQTPTPSAKKKGAGDDDDRIINAIQSMSTQRAINHFEMMKHMKGEDDAAKNNAPGMTRHDVVAQITDTNNQIKDFEEQVLRLEEKKRLIKEGVGSSEQKKKRAKQVKEDIKGNSQMIKTLKVTLKKQREELAKLNEEEDNSSDSSDSDSSGYYST